MLVELSCFNTGAAPASSSGMMAAANTLPSPTPHWSNESMFQMTPCVKTLCSYTGAAISLPSVSGVSCSARMTLLGRLPSNVRCGTTPACPRP